jgi:hypothetical protein
MCPLRRVSPSSLLFFSPSLIYPPDTLEVDRQTEREERGRTEEKEEEEWRATGGPSCPNLKKLRERNDRRFSLVRQATWSQGNQNCIAHMTDPPALRSRR